MLDISEFWDLQLKLGHLKESLNEISNEIRDCDMTDVKTVKYLYKRKMSIIKEIDLYSKKLRW